MCISICGIFILYLIFN